MNVRELIEKLQAVDPELPVWTDDNESPEDEARLWLVRQHRDDGRPAEYILVSMFSHDVGYSYDHAEEL